MARHAISIVSLPSTAMALLYRPWDVFAALLLHLARKPAVKSARAIRWTVRSAPRSHRLALFFAHLWIPAAAAAPPPRTRPPRTAFACKRALVKALGLPGSLPRMPALALVAQRISPSQSLPSKSRARSRAARRVILSRNLPHRASVSTLAARKHSL
jgi:hypothetical protein